MKVGFCTVANEEEGEKIAVHLVKSRLVACVNMLEVKKSFYMWKGKLESHSEVLLIIKTSDEMAKKAEEEIKALHSYSVPEILWIDVVGGNEDYLKWVLESVKGSANS